VPRSGGETALEVALRRDRLIVIASLAGVTVLAWVYLAVLARAMASMEGSGGPAAFMGLMPMGQWGPREYGLGFVMWTLMMVGMMVPSAAPMIVIHARIARRARERGERVESTGAFAAGYLLVWALFSALAAALQGALVALSLMTDTMTTVSLILAGTILIGAGVYQWTPLKRACLDNCRSPMTFLARHWRSGPGGSLRMGLHHGTYCVGCCWGLMAVLFAVGIMNLAWVAAIAVVVLVEKVAPFGVLTGRIAGLALIALGLLTVVQA
jgi:predicted metal-binding membrane protein